MVTKNLAQLGYDLGQGDGVTGAKVSFTAM